MNGGIHLDSCVEELHHGDQPSHKRVIATEHQSFLLCSCASVVGWHLELPGAGRQPLLGEVGGQGSLVLLHTGALLLAIKSLLGSMS